MNPRNLKNGSLIKWEANRMFKSWSTYGRVLSFDGVSAVILTYDDCKKTILTIYGDAIRNEIRLANKNEINKYLNRRPIKKLLFNLRII